MKKSNDPNQANTSLLKKAYETIIENLKITNAELNSENFQLKNLIDNLPGDIYWKDKNGIWSGVNKSGSQSLQKIGFINDRSDVIGKSDYQLFSKETAEEYRNNDLEVMSKKIEITKEETNVLPNGDKIIQLSTKRPLWDKEGNIVGVVGNTIDISYLKKIETELIQAKEKAEIASLAKTEFLENMRHDIRTPLTGIVGFADILKMESTSPHIQEYAENLVASSHALLDLMDDVLEAVRVSSGDIPMLKRKFNLTDIFERIIALNRAKASEKRLDLSLSINSNLPHFAIGDKIRLHRIALELVGNALNFTDSGHVTLDVSLAKKENRQLVIKLIVSDSGMGIPADKQQDIYLKFKRLTPSYQGIYKGAGLGLYVVKQFIDDLGGEIYVDSELNKGTVFTCLIPLQEPLLDDDSGVDNTIVLKTEEPYLTPLTYKQHPPISFESKEKKSSTVLVIEDNFIAQTVAKTLLSAMDCQVDVASNGADAISLCEKNNYDLIFMDIGLGEGMNGYEVTQHIRSNANAEHHTPIIALTAHAGDESKQRCIEAGMDAVLTKPLTQACAADMIKSFIPSRHEASITESSKNTHDLPDNTKELFQLSQFSLLDSEEALKNCGTLDMLKELLTLMTQALPADLDKMKNAFKQQDYALVEKTAHKIKGGAVYVGTTRMKYACQYLERYWKSGERELFEPLYLQAVTTIEDTQKYIIGWLKEKQITV